MAGLLMKIVAHSILLGLVIIWGVSRGNSLFVMPVQLQRDLLGRVATGLRAPSYYLRSDSGIGGLQLIWRYDLSQAEKQILMPQCRNEMVYGVRDSCVLAVGSLDGTGHHDAALIGNKLQLRASWP